MYIYATKVVFFCRFPEAERDLDLERDLERDLDARLAFLVGEADRDLERPLFC